MSKSPIEWCLFDAKDKTLGRLASQIAVELMGKKKVSYKPYQMNNVRVIVINSKCIKVSGDKMDKKKYYRHSGYPGGLKVETLRNLLFRKPNYVLMNAIKGMLPKNKLQKIYLKRLKIYENNIHPHTAQNPCLKW
jgi:large subunit ribosomal protein L13